MIFRDGRVTVKVTKIRTTASLLLDNYLAPCQRSLGQSLLRTPNRADVLHYNIKLADTSQLSLQQMI